MNAGDWDAESRWHWMVQIGDGHAREVSRDMWISIESAAGFHRTIPGYGPATQSFSSDGVRGWRVQRGNTPDARADPGG